MDLDFFADENLSPFEYARHHGLCRDFSQELPDIKSFLPPSVDQILLDLDDDPPKTTITNHAHELTKERLAVSKDAALLLKTVFSLQQLNEEGEQSSRSWKRNASLKQELPILRTDPELDLQNFGSANTPNFTTLHLPLECVDEEKDEGLGWPSKYYDYPSSCYVNAKAEKLPVSKEVLEYLQDTVRDVWTREDLKGIEENITRKRNPAIVPVTPPLLPLSSPVTSYIPSSPDNRLQLLSESSNSTTTELKVLDQQIMKEDSLLPAFTTETSDDSMLLENALNLCPSTDAEVGEPSLPITRCKRSHLEVESPLTPDMSSESPMKKIKSVTFKEMVAEFIPEVPSTPESGDHRHGFDNSVADFFKTATPLLTQVDKMISNEKLSEADTTKRVDVPDVDFALPTAPWIEFSPVNMGPSPDGKLELEAQRKFIVEIKRSALKSMPSWHKMSTPEREMEWSPFPASMGSIAIEEKLHGEEVLSNMLAEITTGDIATSSTDIWKGDGLRILEDDNTDEEELEVVELEDIRTVETLAKRRKLEIDEHNAANDIKTGNLNTRTVIEWHGGPKQVSIPNCQDNERKEEPQKKDNSYLMFGGAFSATSALQSFMEVHGNVTPIEPAKSTQTSTRLLDAVPPPVVLPVLCPSDRSVIATGSSKIPDVGTDAQSKHTLPLSPLPPLPANPEQLAPSSFIISSTLLQQRRLTREIHKIYPNAEMLERNFSPLYSPASEADLLLSPSTGLIFTTLQQIKQQALPGQKNTSPIKERIADLQCRFERLVILVGEGLGREAEQSGYSRPVDSRDQAALAEFDKFTSLMEAEITIQFVRGGELALARAIVWEMSRWGLPHGSTDVGELRLLQDETYWELFLRRAGFNTYASQVILASLKTPFDMPLSSMFPHYPKLSTQAVQVFGLSAFILMSTEERTKRFQVLLGGSRIIRRVNNLLDQEWPSAAHGFKI